MRSGRIPFLVGLIVLSSRLPVKAAGEYLWPITGVVTSTCIYPGGATHSGSVDIATASGTPVHASAGGIVIGKPGGGCGNGVDIDQGGGWHTLYCHFLQPGSVNVGDCVARGQQIGLEGSTGNSTGPNVHLGIFQNGVRQCIPGLNFGDRFNVGDPIAGDWPIPTSVNGCLTGGTGVIPPVGAPIGDTHVDGRRVNLIKGKEGDEHGNRVCFLGAAGAGAIPFLPAGISVLSTGLALLLMTRRRRGA